MGPLRGRRRGIKLILRDIGLKCIDTFICDEDGILVFDVYWTSAPNNLLQIKQEIDQYIYGQDFYDGSSLIFEEGPKSYASWNTHLYYQNLGW
ncbi:MAG: hypothetical protein RTV72_10175 [Candidatus Thorarchaeota archaeon]